jgi:hypothetical protein
MGVSSVPMMAREWKGNWLNKYSLSSCRKDGQDDEVKGLCTTSIQLNGQQDSPASYRCRQPGRKKAAAAQSAHHVSKMWPPNLQPDGCLARTRRISAMILGRLRFYWRAVEGSNPNLDMACIGARPIHAISGEGERQKLAWIALTWYCRSTSDS